MKNKPILKSIFLASSAIGTLSLINHLITRKSISQNLLYNSETEFFNWRYGKVHYSKTGSGAPLVLVHELASDASAYEWNHIRHLLAQTYTVYSLDLLGCGRSEKPDFSYTNATYVQLLSDFIRIVIGKPADVVTSGSSSSIAIMACSAHPELLRRIIMIQPESLHDSLRLPGRISRLRKYLIDCPVIGTFLFHLAFSPMEVARRLNETCSTATFHPFDTEVMVRVEAAHLGGSFARKLYSSLTGNYLHIPFRTALQNTDHSLYILTGEDRTSSAPAEYQAINKAVESAVIPHASYYPHLENPEATAEMIRIFLS